jgi:hypothetical protein
MPRSPTTVSNVVAVVNALVAAAYLEQHAIVGTSPKKPAR